MAISLKPSTVPGTRGAQMEAACFTDKQIRTLEGFPWRVGLLNFFLYF